MCQVKAMLVCGAWRRTGPSESGDVMSCSGNVGSLFVKDLKGCFLVAKQLEIRLFFRLLVHVDKLLVPPGQ